MRDIAALVFGGEPREACEPDEERMCGGMARPGEWCQTPPGRAALAWLGGTHRARESKRDHGEQGSFGRRIF